MVSISISIAASGSLDARFRNFTEYNDKISRKKPSDIPKMGCNSPFLDLIKFLIKFKITMFT